MNLIIESGATKSDWRIVGESGYKTPNFLLPGINLSAMPETAIKGILSEGLDRIDGEPDAIYLYAAGVVTEEINSSLSSFIHSKFPSAKVDIQNDLVAAARAVCGLNGKGIVAIMGTGSNAGFYDGNRLVSKTLSGGYILGDYGSASVLGRMFVTDYLSGDVPNEIALGFEKEFGYSYEDIINNVYYGESPSRFLGSFAPFLMRQYYSCGYIRSLADRNFRLFIETTLKKYDTESYSVGVVGGFGYAYQEIFANICEEHKIRISNFIKNPIDILITQLSD